MKDIGNWRHICVDAQRMFMEDTPWRVPWLERVLQQLLEIAQHHAERTVFTRSFPQFGRKTPLVRGKTIIGNGG
jgi:nicotinamidase-related amidase